MKPALIINNVYVAYGKARVLQGLSLQVEPGSVVAVLGRSGCGKSTLLRACCGLIPLDDGQIILSGQEILHGPHALYQPWEIRRKMMYVAQTPTLLPYISALENLILPLRTVRRFTRGKAMDTTLSAAKALQLSESRLRLYPEQLSGGEAQRVQLLRAMVLQPDVFLLDEVTANIDPETTDDVIKALWQLREHAGGLRTTIIVTHLVDFAERFADRIVFLADGVIAESGPAANFVQDAQKPATRQFLARYRRDI